MTSSNDGKIPVCMRNQYPYLATCYCMKRLIEVSSIFRYETTSRSLAFITKKLLRFPDVQGRFRDEQMQPTTNGRVRFRMFTEVPVYGGSYSGDAQDEPAHMRGTNISNIPQSISTCACI